MHAIAAPVRIVAITSGQHVPLAELPARVAALLTAVPRGSVAIQIREKDLDGGPLFALVRDVVAVARPAGALVLVNDRLDVALAAQADGVHLPERGLTVADTRALAPRSLVVGCSRHTVSSVLDAATAGADLVQLGPVWATPGKDAPCGVEALAAVRARLPATTRLVAVGGIDTPERASAAIRAGADAVAMIRAAWQSPAAVAALVTAVDAARPASR